MFERAKKYISVILQIFVRDAKRIIKTPVAAIILAGACVLPSLYAWYIIEANWDPYSNTNSIKVGVANNDIGTQSSYTGRLDVGKEIIAELKDNHELDWQFVDSEQALENVKSGEYYAAIIFPENFSADFVSVFSGDFHKPEIDYYVNEKMSGAATKVTQTGATTVETKINEAFVSTVSEKIVEIAKHVGTSIEEKEADAQNNLTLSIGEIEAAISENHELMDQLIPTIDSSIQTVGESIELVNTLESSIPTLDDDLEHAQNTLADTRSTLNEYSNEVGKNVVNASLAIANAASTANNAAGQISGYINQAQSAVDTALYEANQLIATNDALINDLENMPGVSAATITNLRNANNSLRNTVSSLQTLSSDLAESAKAADDATKQISDAANTSAANIQSAASRFQNQIVPDLDVSLDAFSSAIGTLRGSLVSLSPTLSDIKDILGELQDTLGKSKETCTDAGESLQLIEDDLKTTLTDLKALQTSATYGALKALIDANPSDIASFMASPVQLNTKTLYPVANYGSGVAPFFSNLALWVCGFIVMALFSQRVDRKGFPNLTRSQEYFSRWLLCIVIALIQALIICVGDIAIGIQCDSPVAFIATGLLAGFVYMNLTYALTYTMRHVGKAISVILLVMQIPGSSGMFPVEIMPAFYRVINPFLPFTYSIDAMREAIGGFYGDHYFLDMLGLGLGFIPLGFLIAFIGIKFGYNINMLFDEKLSKTDLFIAERVPQKGNWFKPRPIVAALLNTKEYQKKIIERAKRFNKHYQKFILAGWIAMILMPCLMLATLIIFHLVSSNATPNDKLILLTIFAAGLVLVVCYLVIINYLHADIQYELSMANGANALTTRSTEVRKVKIRKKSKTNDYAKSSSASSQSSGSVSNQLNDPVSSQSNESDEKEDNGGNSVDHSNIVTDENPHKDKGDSHE